LNVKVTGPVAVPDVSSVMVSVGEVVSVGVVVRARGRSGYVVRDGDRRGRGVRRGGGSTTATTATTTGRSRAEENDAANQRGRADAATGSRGFRTAGGRLGISRRRVRAGVRTRAGIGLREAQRLAGRGGGERGAFGEFVGNCSESGVSGCAVGGHGNGLLVVGILQPPGGNLLACEEFDFNGSLGGNGGHSHLRGGEKVALDGFLGLVAAIGFLHRLLLLVEKLIEQKTGWRLPWTHPHSPFVFSGIIPSLRASSRARMY